MSDSNKTVTLSGGSCYICENDTDAYRIHDGNVLVFVVPVKEIGPGRRSFIYEAKEGEIIPSFYFRDSEYINWRFCFSSFDRCSLEIIEHGSSKLLKERFVQKIGLREYYEEGFNGGMVDRYKNNLLKEDVLLKKNQARRSSAYNSVLEQIYFSFRKKKLDVFFEPSNDELYDAVDFLCKKLSISIAPFEKVKDAYGDDFTIENLAGISYFSIRKIVLPENWETKDCGSFLAFDNAGHTYACICEKIRLSGNMSYYLINGTTGEVIPVTNKVAQNISPCAYMLYRPLPAEKLTAKSLFSFCLKSIKRYDIITLILLTLILSGIGLILPTINQKIYDTYIPLGGSPAKEALKGLIVLMLTCMSANLMISIVKQLSTFRIVSGLSNDLGSAFIDRVFNMPGRFFRGIESADLTSRILSVRGIASTTASSIISGSLCIIFVIIYFAKMISVSKSMAGIALLMVLVYAIIYYCINELTIKRREKEIEFEASSENKLYQFISGIEKIKLAGVEDKAIFEYMKPYIHLRDSSAKSENILLIGNVFSTLATAIFSVVFYYIAVQGNSSTEIGSFIAFLSIFGIFESNVMEIVSDLVGFRQLRPSYRYIKPLMEYVPEFEQAKELPGEISGEIEINNVTFGYSQEENNVINDLSLNIKPGEYIGIVGESGCGKSTLVKLLLGFEKPKSGKIYYDNKDLESVDKRELRKKMGVVTQNGKLIAGNIIENITLTAPYATIEDVNYVLERVGLLDEINSMPMKLGTLLNENSTTISGGQQQRLLIARALVSNPRILIFDEATSALDNISQATVCETLKELNITRIVIAHRLSTIVDCDRIVVMNKGRIAEIGTYDELIKMNGIFASLASRQMV